MHGVHELSVGLSDVALRECALIFSHVGKEIIHCIDNTLRVCDVFVINCQSVNNTRVFVGCFIGHFVESTPCGSHVFDVSC